MEIDILSQKGRSVASSFKADRKLLLSGSIDTESRLNQTHTNFRELEQPQLQPSELEAISEHPDNNEVECEEEGRRLEQLHEVFEIRDTPAIGAAFLSHIVKENVQ